MGVSHPGELALLLRGSHSRPTMSLLCLSLLLVTMVFVLWVVLAVIALRIYLFSPSLSSASGAPALSDDLVAALEACGLTCACLYRGVTSCIDDRTLTLLVVVTPSGVASLAVLLRGSLSHPTLSLLCLSLLLVTVVMCCWW